MTTIRLPVIWIKNPSKGLNDAERIQVAEIDPAQILGDLPGRLVALEQESHSHPDISEALIRIGTRIAALDARLSPPVPPQQDRCPCGFPDCEHNKKPEQPKPAGDNKAACPPMPIHHLDGRWKIAGEVVDGEQAADQFWKIIVHKNTTLDAKDEQIAATNGAMLQVREDNEKLAAHVAELEAMIQPKDKQVADALIAQVKAENDLADALKAKAEAEAELAAMKARKVKLPTASAQGSAYQGDEYSAYESGLEHMRESCAEAIRAAGLEVAE